MKFYDIIKITENKFFYRNPDLVSSNVLLYKANLLKSAVDNSKYTPSLFVKRGDLKIRYDNIMLFHKICVTERQRNVIKRNLQTNIKNYGCHFDIIKREIDSVRFCELVNITKKEINIKTRNKYLSNKLLFGSKQYHLRVVYDVIDVNPALINEIDSISALVNYKKFLFCCLDAEQKYDAYNYDINKLYNIAVETLSGGNID